MMVAAGGEAPEVRSPAAAVLARRASRAALPETMQVAAADESSDEEWREDDPLKTDALGLSRTARSEANREMAGASLAGIPKGALQLELAARLGGATGGPG